MIETLADITQKLPEGRFATEVAGLVFGQDVKVEF